MSEYPQQLDPMEDGGSQLPLCVLKKARDQQGKSLEEISDRLKISVAHLDALESGDIESLPGLAFACGYIRTYARFLGLDADALIRDFKAAYGSDSLRPVTTINRVKPQAHLGDPIIRASVLVFVLILIGSSIWWWQAQMGDQSAFDGERSPLSSEAVLDDLATPGSASMSAPVIQVPAAVENPGDAVPAAEVLEVPGLSRELEAPADQRKPLGRQEQPSPEPASAAAAIVSNQPVTPPESRAAESSRLVLRFSSECWVSIKNADGKTLFASLLQAGDTLERELDSLPVELLIGSTSSVVQAEFQGQPLMLAEHARKGVARLTLK